MVYTDLYQGVGTMTSPKRELVTAKLFRNGRSQAVRLPKDFRFPGTEVLIRKEGETVVLEPIKQRRWPRGYWERLREMQVDYPVEPMSVRLGEDVED
jgi:antitoxin VapB